ncbi:hypothetical protein [Aquimarina algiphila]|uniref:hypothetical protein n=1 Tax=Aquimarina algiphila TaxID=2047982 RepID=UPI00232E7E6E|nr:hypothetical protein [Aquimarina algiphila]
MFILLYIQTPIVEEAEQMLFMIIKMMFLLGLIAASIFFLTIWLGRNPSERLSEVFHKIKGTKKVNVIDAFIVTQNMQFRVDSRFNGKGTLRHFLEFRISKNEEWQKIQAYKDMLKAQINLEQLENKREQLDEAFTESLYK